MDERQIEFKFYEEDIRLSKSGTMKRDCKLEEFFRRQVKRQLHTNDPITRAYVSELAINSLISQIVSSQMVGSTSYPFSIWVSSYEAIDEAWEIQKWRLELIGKKSRNNYFAVIDSTAATIAIHIPKSKRQIAVENMVDEAIKEFHLFLQSRKMCPMSNFDEVVKEYLALEKHPKYLKPIKIVLLWKKMNGEYDVRTLANERKIYLQYKKSRNILYYYIPRY